MRRGARLFRRSLASLLLAALPVALPPRHARSQATAQPPKFKVETNTGGGVRTVMFGDTLLYGQLNVYLPDDMSAGDTISGTVSVEPSGKTAEERAKNRDLLGGYKLELRPSAAAPVTVNLRDALPDSSFNVNLPAPALTADTRPPPPAPHLEIRVLGADGAVINVPLLPAFTTPPATASDPPSNFQLPTLGQQGRTVEIFGAFDGDSANTLIYWNPTTAASPDSEKNTESVAGGFGLIRPLAESPRKAVFRSPTDAEGVGTLALKERNVEVKGLYRNVGVRLSAPKTNLTRGERTTLTVEVRGLGGVREPVPLQLDARGVIDLEGGNFQNILIPPGEVMASGRYTLTRNITARQAGSFTCTATVVVRRFDACLRDDAPGGPSLLWNTFNGNYVFILPRAPVGGASQTGVASAPPVAPPLTGAGKVSMKGCIITLQHNAPDRRIMARLDTCTKTGDASAQTDAPKASFGLTDKNTADSVCPVPR